ncbi:hypothetical protein TRVA0_033S01530 [Trichomonascus vanleenenianus]|uniref:S-adenosylmethionine-dependent methyltransferase n=1 Tax=Trichomonascus vanleenenianus TaxID=2268995 RepID=UPI003ECAF569
MLHVLDLPHLTSKPSAQDLIQVLSSLAPKKTKNFGSREPGEIYGGLSGFFTWLTSLVGSPLEWIVDEADKEQIWALASTRMAERCGRSAAPTQTREMEVPGLEGCIELIEPALTEDSLGFKTWGSSLVLAKKLIANPHMVRQGPVLELGAGTGLVGIVAGKLGAQICVTDLPAIVKNMRKNVELNEMSEQVEVETLDWLNPDEFDPAHARKFTTILVADPLYSEEHPAMVCNMVDRFLNKEEEDARAVVQLPQRRKFEDVRQMFYDKMQKLGFKRVEFEVEHGEEEFGDMGFERSIWRV